MPMTVWSMLEECVGQLDEPFRRSEIVGWFRRHYPDVNEATLAAHIQAATANAANRAGNNALGRRPALIDRIDRGLYRRARRPMSPLLAASFSPAVEPADGGHGDVAVVLIGCVKTKWASAAPASELYVSPLFEGRREYARRAGMPWYILSAKHGLLSPADIIGPYDVYLGAQSRGYQQALGEFAAAQLDQLQPGLRGRTVEIHAGSAYVEAVREPLTRRGIRISVPLDGLELGRQLSWYRSRVSTAPEPAAANSPQHVAQEANTVLLRADEIIGVLRDRSLRRSPAELISAGRDGLLVPGLYSWWVDDRGAADLSAGLGLPVSAGLIYAGQAGATHWPSGRRSAGTLWGRITQMHLGGSAEFSTFRRTLAAVLRDVQSLTSEDDPRLTAWVDRHLSVITVPVPDADRLGRIESEVLDVLDPPLNLMGRPGNPLRTRLRQLRRERHQHGDTEMTGESGTAAGGQAVIAAKQFHRAMVGIYETAKRDLGYNATRFLQMISEQGGLATARQLLWSDTPSDGFTTLWQHGRLDLTVEAHALKPEFAILFTDEDRQRATRRLETYG
jgi:hypothetical protein